MKTQTTPDIFNMEYTTELLNKLQIDWLYKAFPHPKLILDFEDAFDLILHQKINNPVDVVHYITYKKGIHPLPSAKFFYKAVLKNPVIDSLEKLDIAYKIYLVSENIQHTIENMISLVFRYIHNSTFKTFIDKAFENNKEINPFWSDRHIDELLGYYFEKREFIPYHGELELPLKCSLIQNNINLFQEGKEMNHCIYDYWEDVLKKKYFVISMRYPERVTFLIDQDPYMKWFRIQSAHRYNNQRPSNNSIAIMAEYIKKEENQNFLLVNYNHSSKEFELPEFPDIPF
ncbi:PcfJ domain-containing protein [Plebeiibacterium sediminum]|uniref:PcfJ domain-containing protein n=1 Tax=Plebeiibacterium sediminum TaxID=2992112 RepID=A0AAE3M4T9_9BACT|nr:PcfJ domain-containing protein [Plebeiobacterium sediminum]MCW3786852.1 PcfJ domain-containing protein [Plebeiobacterium sediminum]